MRISKMIFALVLFLALLLTGCNSGASNTESVIASEKTLPLDFYESAFERETTPTFSYLVRKTVNQSDFEETWDLYEFEGAMPNADFDEKNALFIGVIESGSCPYELGDFEWINDDTMKVPLIEPEGACTTDATPRTFVIEIDKEKSSELENLVIVQSGISTTVPFEN